MSQPPPDLAAFCQAQYPRLVGALGLYCGDRGVAEELAQEALARVCRDWKKVKVLSAPEAWTHRVGINLAHSFFRRRAAESRAMARAGAGGQTAPSSAEHAELLDLVHRLPHRQRSAIILRYYLGFTVREVAHALDCPEGTAKTLIHRAVRAMGRTLRATNATEASDVV